MSIDTCVCCGAQVDTDVTNHWIDEGESIGFLCDACYESETSTCPFCREDRFNDNLVEISAEDVRLMPDKYRGYVGEMACVGCIERAQSMEDDEDE